MSVTGQCTLYLPMQNCPHSRTGPRCRSSGPRHTPARPSSPHSHCSCRKPPPIQGCYQSTPHRSKRRGICIAPGCRKWCLESMTSQNFEYWAFLFFAPSIKFFDEKIQKVFRNGLIRREILSQNKKLELLLE